MYDILLLLIRVKCRFRQSPYELHPRHISLSHTTFYGFYVLSGFSKGDFFFHQAEMKIVLLALAQLCQTWLKRGQKASILHTTEHSTWTPHTAYQHQTIQADDPGDSGADEQIHRLSSMDKGDKFRIYIQDQFSGLYREPESGSPASSPNHSLLPWTWTSSDKTNYRVCPPSTLKEHFSFWLLNTVLLERVGPSYFVESIWNSS